MRNSLCPNRAFFAGERPQQQASSAVSKSKSRRTAVDAQPLPRKNLQSDTATERKNEKGRLALAEGCRVVNWLNASQGTASEQRAIFLRNELATLPQDWAIHNRDWAIHNTRAPWGHPGLRKGWLKDQRQMEQNQRQLEQRHRTLNELLSRYAFRPRVTHRVFRGEWVFGMVPDEKRQWFTMRIGTETTSEADAVMSLLRLASTGDLSKICRCRTCRDRWMFKAKRNYQFCSAECRETFYANAPDYHDRKAKNQREYRQRLKRAKANFIG